jgi:hypothetical protein
MGAGRRKMVTVVEHGLVSGQARGDHSLRNPSILAALARCEESGPQLFGPTVRMTWGGSARNSPCRWSSYARPCSPEDSSSQRREPDTTEAAMSLLIPCSCPEEQLALARTVRSPPTAPLAYDLSRLKRLAGRVDLELWEARRNVWIGADCKGGPCSLSTHICIMVALGLCDGQSTALSKGPWEGQLRPGIRGKGAGHEVL